MGAPAGKEPVTNSSVPALSSLSEICTATAGVGWSIFCKEITVLIVINLYPFICVKLTPTKESNKQINKKILPSTDQIPNRLFR